MIAILRTARFASWLKNLRDHRAVAKIAVRIDRLADGHPGDVKPVGDGVSEMRIDHGPGYRVYFDQRGDVAIMLLVGGDKSSQARDILAARKLAREWKDMDRDL